MKTEEKINDEIMDQIMEAITKMEGITGKQNSADTKKILFWFPFVLVQEHLCLV